MLFFVNVIDIKIVCTLILNCNCLLVFRGHTAHLAWHCYAFCGRRGKNELEKSWKENKMELTGEEFLCFL